MRSTTIQRVRPQVSAGPAIRAGGRDRPAASAAERIVVECHRSLPAAEALWRALETSRTCAIHQTYDWCKAWVESHDSDVRVLTGVLDGAPAFVLPLEVIRRGPLRIARYIASPFSNINNGIFSEGFRAASTDAAFVAGWIGSLRCLDVDCVVLEKLPLSWRGMRHPLAALPAIENQNRSFQVTLHADFNAVLAQVNAKRRRKKFRNSERRLEAIGGYEHVIARTPEEARLLLSTFFDQKAARFEAHGIADVFADPKVRGFFLSLAAGPAGPWQPLELHAIRLKGDHDGAYCAISGLSIKGDHVLCQFGSIDDSLCPDASPGELLFHLMIERACTQGAALFDFGIGDQAYKRSWCDVETVQHDILLSLNLRGRLMAAGITSAVAAKRLLKQNPRAYRIAQKLRFLKARLVSRKAS